MAKKLNINKDAYVATTGITLEQMAKSLSGIVVVEKGTNGNGSWIKCSNGILIQYGKITGVSISKANGAYSTITLPKPYIDSNYNIQTQMLGVPSYWSWIVQTIDESHKTNANFRINWWNNSNDSAINTTGSYWCTFGLWTEETQPNYIPPTSNQMQELINLLEDLPIAYTVTTDANGWTVIDNPTLPYIEYYKKGIKNISLNAGGWTSQNLSNLPVGVTGTDAGVFGMGSFECWDGAFIAELSMRESCVQVACYWHYGGNAWNKNHNWSFRIVKMRS